MADVLRLAPILLLIILSFQVKKIAFVCSDTIGLSIEGKELLDTQESYIISSLWQSRSGKYAVYYRSAWLNVFICMLLLLCGDIERCPGPIYQNDITRNSPEMNSLLGKRGIKIFHQNVRGLSSNINLVSVLLQTFRGIDVLTLSETHIESDDEHRVFYNISGYSFVSRSRKAGKGGGVGVYISDDVTWDRRKDLEVEEIESVWIEIWPCRQHWKGILFSTIYRPPDTSKYLHDDFNTVFNSMMTKASEESKEMIVLGHMNVNFLVPGNNKDLKSVFELFGLKQTIEKPTRITEKTRTLIDIVLTNTPANIAGTDVIATSIGDHDMPGRVRKINNSRFNPRLITCRDYKTYNAENMKSELKKVDWTPFYSQRNVNEAWAKMKHILSDIFGRNSPMIP
eukprot:gene892-189_t